MPRRPLAPTTNLFPLDWRPTAAEMADLQANVLEGAAYVLRHTNRVLTAENTLAPLTAWTPALSPHPLGELSAQDLTVLVGRLRRAAEIARLRDSMGLPSNIEH